MTRYLIKSTYIDGPHTGKSHLMRKGGRITEEDDHQWNDTTYASVGRALAECKRLFENNETNYDAESREREYQMKTRGHLLHEWRIYNHETYEPYMVEVK